MLRNRESEKIAKAMSSLDIYEYGDVLQCMRCGLCLPTCPTYRTDGLETQSPRGRVAMIKGVIDGMLPASRTFIDHMYHCLDCRNCQTVCPAGVKAGELVLEARHRIEECRAQPLLKRFLLNYAIEDQDRLGHYMLPLRVYQRTGIQSLVRKYGHLLRLISEDLEHMEALLPVLPMRPLADRLPVETPAQGSERGRVGFFLGCAMNLMYADVSAATVQVLSRAGFTVVTPRGIKCCGAPNMSEGERRTYRAMARHNIALFEAAGVDYVVTDCAACGSELKGYREAFHRDPAMAARAVAFAEKVRDISEFLAAEPADAISFSPLREQVCFHDPCHLRHAQGIVSPPRELLLRIPGLELIEVPDEGHCCGSAGTYMITHRERSLKILEAKIRAIGLTGAQRVITSNPGCMMQLDYARRRGNQQWQVSHISEILGDALG
ncbi:MAG: (Fe-S)-binding protein [Thermodesulfobacteriota bacterium]